MIFPSVCNLVMMCDALVHLVLGFECITACVSGHGSLLLFQVYPLLMRTTIITVWIGSSMVVGYLAFIRGSGDTRDDWCLLFEVFTCESEVKVVGRVTLIIYAFQLGRVVRVWVKTWLVQACSHEVLSCAGKKLWLHMSHNRLCSVHTSVVSCLWEAWCYRLSILQLSFVITTIKHRFSRQ